MTSPSGRSSTPRRDRRRAHPPAPAQAVGRRGELDPDHQAPLADLLTAPGGGATRSASRPRARSHRARTLASTSTLVEQLEVAEGHRGREGVPGVGVTVVQRQLGQIGAEEGVVHAPARDRRRHRQVPAGEALAEARAGRGADAALLGREQRAGAAEPGGDLVADEQHVVPAGTRRPAAREALGIGQLHAGRALHERLDDDRGQLRGVRVDRRSVAEPRRSRRRRAPGAPGSAAGRTRRCRTRRRPPTATPIVSPW